MNGILLPEFKSTPYWWEAAPPETTDASAPLPPKADVVIVGGGYAGLSAASELRRSGVGAVVLDKGPLGIGASTRASGGVTSGYKLVLAGPKRDLSAERLKQMLEESLASFNCVTALVEEDGFDTDFQRTGRYFAAYSRRQYDLLLHMGALLRDQPGITVRDIPRAEQAEVMKGDFYHGGILVNEYGSIDPAKLHRSLRADARRRGAALLSNTGVTGVARKTGGFRVSTVRGDIEAEHVILATNGYTGGVSGYLAPRLIPVASYLIATEPMPPEQVLGLLPRGRIVSDSQRNLYFVRPSPDGTRILFSARPTALDRPEREAALIMHAALCRIWPEMEGIRISHCWRGNVAMTFDHKPHLGLHDGLYYVVGCNGSGIAMMTYLGRQIARRLLGTETGRSAFETEKFPRHLWYNGRHRWFLPLVTKWYDLRDEFDRKFY